MKAKKYKIGDEITSQFSLLGQPNKKIKVVGKIKNIESQYGHTTYTIEGGSVGEFKTRTILEK